MSFASTTLLAADTFQILLNGLYFIAAATFFAVALLFSFYGRTWLQAYMSNATISFQSLIGMSFRQVKIGLIVKSRIVLEQAGLTDTTTSELESHFLAGGNLENTVQALVVASRSGMMLDFNRAAAIDLAGRDVLAAVMTSVLPRVIDCPNSSRSSRTAISAVAKDGVELKIQARVTVRTNIEFLIGGATEATIVARVGQGIITAVGSADTHSDVLCRPEEISKLLVSQGLDSNTAYEIVSIDIARIDVGANIGARIRTDQAAADMQVSQALSESRRAHAVALQQEMRAHVQQRKAELVQAEALIPSRIGAGFRDGNVGHIPTDCKLGAPASLLELENSFQLPTDAI